MFQMLKWDDVCLFKFEVQSVFELYKNVSTSLLETIDVIIRA